jgi:hypothetical protein
MPNRIRYSFNFDRREITLFRSRHARELDSSAWRLADQSSLRGLRQHSRQEPMTRSYGSGRQALISERSHPFLNGSSID